MNHYTCLFIKNIPYNLKINNKLFINGRKKTSTNEEIEHIILMKLDISRPAIYFCSHVLY